MNFMMVKQRNCSSCIGMDYDVFSLVSAIVLVVVGTDDMLWYGILVVGISLNVKHVWV